MNYPKQIELMHAVLDGEASEEQSRDLDRILTTNAAAAAEFNQLRQLFHEVSRAPEVNPPDRLVESVIAQVRFHPGTRGSV